MSVLIEPFPWKTTSDYQHFVNHTHRSKFHNAAIVAALNMALLCLNPAAQAAPNFGSNVIIFYPSTPRATIQSTLDTIFAKQNSASTSQFGTNRYAIFFMPGTYTNIAVNMGYYMQVLGLGQSPDDVTINGLLDVHGFLANHNATCNFWMSSENLAVSPTNSGGYSQWAVSQATSFRRMHVKGALQLSDTGDGAYSSGGFLADSKVDSTVSPGSQQQWFSRNDVWTSWGGRYGTWYLLVFQMRLPEPGPVPSIRSSLIHL